MPATSHPVHVALARRLLEQIDGTRAPGPTSGEVPASRYTSAARWAEERDAIFRRTPLLVGLEAELAAPGTCVAFDAGGIPLLVVRGDDGVLRAFRNACRHRATELVAAGAPCTRKAFVCPYHGWTYDLAGSLLHVPHRASFDGRERSRDALGGAHVAARHGFVWASSEPFDLDVFLDPIGDELASIGVADLAAYKRTEREVAGNWKLVIDAFLDGYHIRQLHRSTVYRFFLDACSEAELAGRHIRAATARRTLVDGRTDDLDRVAIRELCTPSYVVFPNVVLVLHPDYVSVMVATPISEERTRFAHTMLVPHDRLERDAEHWARSFTLIDEGVFASEDLATVEAMQRGLRASVDTTVLFGRAEHAALWFHEVVERAIDDGSTRVIDLSRGAINDRAT